MIHMFWEECNEPSFYKHICKPDNFTYLTSKNVIYPLAADIVRKYLEEDEENWSRTKKCFSLSTQAHILKSIALLKNAT